MPIFIILSDIEESTIIFSYFYFFKDQRWPNRFVYITTNRSCCPLNCSSVQAKSPICRSRSRSRSPSCSTSSSPSAATTSMSGRKQPWAGQVWQLPGLALSLYHQVVGHHPGQLILEAQQYLLAPEKCPFFFFRCSGSCAEPVMSTNIRIFEYSNKTALEYYSYSYLCHFPTTHIFGYSFVDFWTTEYIQIFVRKFSKIRLYLNICSEPYFNIQLSIFNEKGKSRYNLCIKNIQCKILFRGNISECFKKISSISD